MCGGVCFLILCLITEGSVNEQTAKIDVRAGFSFWFLFKASAADPCVSLRDFCVVYLLLRFGEATGQTKPSVEGTWMLTAQERPLRVQKTKTTTTSFPRGENPTGPSAGTTLGAREGCSFTPEDEL